MASRHCIRFFLYSNRITGNHWKLPQSFLLYSAKGLGPVMKSSTVKQNCQECKKDKPRFFLTNFELFKGHDDVVGSVKVLEQANCKNWCRRLVPKGLPTRFNWVEKDSKRPADLIKNLKTLPEKKMFCEFLPAGGKSDFVSNFSDVRSIRITREFTIRSGLRIRRGLLLLWWDPSKRKLIRQMIIMTP